MDRGSRDTDGRTDDRSQGRRYKSFRRLLVRFAEKTSMQGVPYIHNAKLIGARIVWVILLLAAMAAMGLHLWYLTTQYISFPYTAKVSFGFGNLRLPEITICNTNPIHKGRLDAFDGAEELKRLINDISPEKIAPEQFDDDEYYEMYSEFYTLIDGQYVFNESALEGVTEDDIDEYGGFDPESYDSEFEDWFTDDDFEYEDDEYDGAIDSQARLYEVFRSLYMDLAKDDRANLGHYIKDMLLTCAFNGRVCNSSMFNLFQTPEYGNCFTLSNSRFTVLDSGPSSGLSLVLFLESTQYLEGVTQGYGIQVHIHEPGTLPDPYESGFLVPASMETNIGLKMIQIERIGKPHSECEPGGKFRQLYNRTYSRKSCRQFCQVTKAIESCGCYDDSWEDVVEATRISTRLCNTSADWNCIARVERQFQQKTLTCTCLNPCLEISYSKDISSRQWPNEGYSRILLKQVCDRDLDECNAVRNNSSGYQIYNNFLKLNVYYEDLNFEKIKEEADIEEAQFMSDVGGAVGLWIGLSILSLCEVIQLIIEIIDLAVHRSCRAGKRNRQQDKQSRYRSDDDREHPSSDERDGGSHYPPGDNYAHLRGDKYHYDYPSQFDDDRSYRYPYSHTNGSRPYSIDSGIHGRDRRL